MYNRYSCRLTIEHCLWQRVGSLVRAGGRAADVQLYVDKLHWENVTDKMQMNTCMTRLLINHDLVNYTLDPMW